MRKRIPALMLALLIAVPAIGQTVEEPKFSEKVDVNLVLIDAIVTNAKGEQILGLDKNDFVVEENGVPQKIESVDYYTNRRLATGPEKEAKFDVERVNEPRYFIFFFDKFPGAAPIEGFDEELWRAVRYSKDFVKKDLMDQDYVAVVGHDARLEIYTDFTRDKDRILGALEEARRFGSGNFDVTGDPSIVKHLDEQQVRNHTGYIWDAMEVLGQSLSEIRGRKMMLLFSPGFTSRSPGVTLLEDHDYNPMVQALNESNTSVYGLNLLQYGDAPIADVNLSKLVDDTGGDYYRRPVNYLTPLRQIENRNNGYYLITYRSTKPATDHGYQEVKVAVKNREFRVEAREGYLY